MTDFAFDDDVSGDALPFDAALAPFFADQWITEVVRVLKSGKEGTVYCCRAAPRAGQEFLAAKVYRSREHRNFHNSAIYEEGRWIGDKRIKRAITNKSRVGRGAQAELWVDHEHRTLQLLHAAGAAVPRPFARAGQALLMTYLGDEEDAAPLLQHARIDQAEADPLFRRLLAEVERWLRCGVIHADLSPFNILYWQGEPTVIDFPQAVDPETNPNARALLTRDLANVCRFFARFGLRADPDFIADRLWRTWESGRW